MNESPDILKQEFQDEEYRYAYAEDFLNTSIAMQIRVLREQRNNMTQQELADAIGTKQAGISRLENVNYSAWKTGTLRKIARALKVRLKITFETFGTLLDETQRFSRDSLERPDFEHDPVFAGSFAAEPMGLASAAVGLTPRVSEGPGQVTEAMREQQTRQPRGQLAVRLMPGNVMDFPQHLTAPREEALLAAVGQG